MLDPFLIIGLIVLIIITVIANVYLIAYWQHPEDKNDSYFAKFIILSGMELATLAVLLIPVDVANGSGNPQCDVSNPPSGVYCGGLNLFQGWESIFSMICFVVVVLIPFETLYYEAKIGLDPSKKPRCLCCSIMIYEMVVIVSFLVLILGLYFTSAGTHIPVVDHVVDLSHTDTISYRISPGDTPYQFVNMTLSSNDIDFLSSNRTIILLDHISFSLAFPVYLIGLFGWCGWWLFAVFAGVGLTALPFELITTFIWRPKLLAPDELAQKELEIQERTNELLEIAQMMKKDRQIFFNNKVSRGAKGKRNVADRLELNKLTQMVFLLDRDSDELRICKNMRSDYNPLVPYFCLAAGVFFVIISIVWVLQIVLYMIPKKSKIPFLNTYLVWFDIWFPMFGNLTYACFSLYLLACTVKGCFKVGLRFLCIKLHPMEAGKTYVSSFLFNLAIILVCSIPVVHFCTLAFAGYAVDTDAFLVFNVEIFNLQFFSQFYQNDVFVWILLLASMISIPYFLWKPREVAGSTEDFKQQLHRRGAGYASLPSKSLELTSTTSKRSAQI